MGGLLPRLLPDRRSLTAHERDLRPCVIATAYSNALSCP
jgi:hypothetical protein